MFGPLFANEGFSEGLGTLDRKIKLLNWNIRNPSIDRAKLQSEWITKNEFDIVLLTEAKYSKGCIFIRDWLRYFGFSVFFVNDSVSDYSVLMAIRSFKNRILDIKLDFLPHRLMSISVDTYLGEINIIGLYVPSRGPRERRNVNKREFQKQVTDLLHLLVKNYAGHNFIIGGDLNVLERKHIPHYTVFGKWEYEFYDSFESFGFIDAYRLIYPNDREYSWFGRKGDGYRFDHFFISSGLTQYIVDCSYIHVVRDLNLSDHSAMCLVVHQG